MQSYNKHKHRTYKHNNRCIYIYTHTYYFLARTRTRLAGLEDVVADGAERLRGPMVGLRRNPA